MAMELARNPTVLVVNDTVFAHGGLLPIHGERAGCSTGGGAAGSCAERRGAAAHRSGPPARNAARRRPQRR